MRDAENIREVEALGIDLMGFIFYPKSSRYVSERPAYLPTRCKRVGVFVDASADDIIKKIQDFSLDIIQLHGNESPEQISHLLSLTSHLSIIKAFNIASAADLAATAPYVGLVDYFLFDTKATISTASPAVYGGTGSQFDWSILDKYDGSTPFLLSGGIGPDDAQRLRKYHHPLLAGIDLNSRFEQSPALKDITKLKAFLYEYNQ